MQDSVIAALLVVLTIPVFFFRKRIIAIIQTCKRKNEECPAIVANMGEKMKFYYDVNRKSWVMPGEEAALDEALTAKGAPPPLFPKRPPNASSGSEASQSRYVDPATALGLPNAKPPVNPSLLSVVPPPTLVALNVPARVKSGAEIEDLWDRVLATEDSGLVSEGFRLVSRTLEFDMDSLSLVQIALGLLTSLVLLRPLAMDERALALASAAYARYAEDEDVACAFYEVIVNLRLAKSPLAVQVFDRDSKKHSSENTREWLKLVTMVQ